MAWQLVATLENLPVPPTVNNAYINFRGGRRASQSHTDFKLECQKWALGHYRELHRIRPLVSGKILAMGYSYHLQRSRLYTKKGGIKRFDVSNRIKLLEDSMCRMIQVDDSHVWVLKASKVEVARRIQEQVVITIWAHEIGKLDDLQL